MKKTHLFFKNIPIFLKKTLSKKQLAHFRSLNREFSQNTGNVESVGVKKYDCIVVGLGAQGSSTLYHLAKRGGSSTHVLGIEQFKIAHNYGSSHGLSRIIRLSYFEHSAYVALLRRAFQLWYELEEESGGERLLTRTGSLDIGKKESRIFSGSRQTCEQENLRHEILSQTQLMKRFPGWQNLPTSANLSAVYQHDGGYLHPERCVSAFVNLAKNKYGAHVREEETVESIEIYNRNNEVLVRTNKSEYLTSKLILSSGPWLGGFIKNSPALSKIASLQKISSILTPQRNVVIWYRSSTPELYRPSNFPVFVLDYNTDFFYGFPITGETSSESERCGFKIGKYNHRKETLAHESLGKEAKWRERFDREDEEVIGAAVKDLLPSAYGQVLRHASCIFTNTPDEHFIVDACPDPTYRCIGILSACSGHGFKFASVIGEIMATLVQTKKEGSYEYANVDWLKAKRFY